MLHTFVFSPEDLQLNIHSEINEDVPLAFSASPYTGKGLPVGLLAMDGKLYSSVPEGLPALVMYKKGNVEIRKRYTVNHLLRAKAVVSGSALLVEDYARLTPLVSPLNLLPDRRLDRLGLGLLGDGTLLIAAINGTVGDLQDVFMWLEAEDAMMLAFNNIYLNYARGGVNIMGSNVVPITVFQVKNALELIRPLVVLDGGHGGSDPGACAFGVKEKDYTLRGIQYIRDYLINNYNVTVLLTRDVDSSVELGVRGRMAVQLKADLFVSLHINAGKGTGCESFCQPGCTKTTQTLRHIVHQSMAAYLVSHGVKDRGEKYANLQVTRDCTKGGINAMLLEPLFIDTPADLKLLQDSKFFIGLCQSIAEGIAKGLGLSKKITGLAPDASVAASNKIPTPQVLYKVQVGAFQYRKGAEALQAQLKCEGFDAMIVEDDGR